MATGCSAGRCRDGLGCGSGFAPHWLWDLGRPAAPLSEPESPPLSSGHKDGPHLQGQVRGLNCKMQVSVWKDVQLSGGWSCSSPALPTRRPGVRGYGALRGPPAMDGHPGLQSQAWDLRGWTVGQGSIKRSSSGTRRGCGVPAFLVSADDGHAGPLGSPSRGWTDSQLADHYLLGPPCWGVIGQLPQTPSGKFNFFL